MLFRSVWDRKPIGLFALYRLFVMAPGGGLVAVMLVAAMLVALIGPVIEWLGLVTPRGHGLWDWMRSGAGALLVMASEILPVIIFFSVQVRWSVRKVNRARLRWTALGFGVAWMLGQQVFTWYVGGVMRMDAVTPMRPGPRRTSRRPSPSAVPTEPMVWPIPWKPPPTAAR